MSRQLTSPLQSSALSGGAVATPYGGVDGGAPQNAVAQPPPAANEAPCDMSMEPREYPEGSEV